jgi:hypothetical protein
MLQVGTSGSFTGNYNNPIVITDVFVRVGGPSNGVGPVGSMVLIQSGYTIIDNTWLWRADHGVDGTVYNGENPVKNGLIVLADNVYAYGLAVEHTIEDNVIWRGNNGITYFFQAEIMYDYLESVWNHSCYKVEETVSGHYASGMGCYSFFRDASSYAERGLDTSAAKNISVKSAVSVWLNGYENSGIKNVINDDKRSVDSTNRVQYNC